MTSFEDCSADRTKVFPQFQFWFTILQLELVIMLYVRAIRESDFLLHIDALTKLIPYVFALDHTHYTRWTLVHFRDMVAFKQTHSAIFSEFLKEDTTLAFFVLASKSESM